MAHCKKSVKHKKRAVMEEMRNKKSIKHTENK